MALATSGPEGLNVVPLSVAAVHNDEVLLYDFFMRKTRKNLQTNPQATLACWNGFSGLQIRAAAKYETDGELFQAAASEMAERFPERTLYGIIRLTPEAAYDLAPGASGEDLL